MKFSASHEWVKELPGGVYEVGLSEHAAGEMGDIVYVTLPEVGDALTVGGTAGSVESVKAVSDVISPLSGEVIEVNSALEDAPEQLNQAAHDAWIFRANDVTAFDTLMDADAYAAYVAEGA